MGMTLTKEFVNNCRNVGALRDFLCQAIDQVDEKDKEIAELRENQKKAIERDTENWNRLCVKYNKLIELKKELDEKFKDIELEIDK